MPWRGPFWSAFIIVCGVIVVGELVTETRTAYVIATVLAQIFLAAGIARLDAEVCGIQRHARRHFGHGWHQLTEVTKQIPEREWFNVYQAMQALKNEQQMREPVGVNTSYAYYGPDLDADEYSAQSNAMSLTDLIRDNARLQRLKYRTLESNSSRPLRIADNALFLLRVDMNRQDLAVAASLQRGILQVAAKSEEIAYQAIQLIERKSQEVSVYRGHVLTCKSARKGGYRIEFVEPRPVAREQIILPAQVLEILDRNILQVIRHAEGLRRSGRNLQHGVLLYGPPGTGKSLAVRFLTTAAKPITVVTVTGRQLRLVRESCRLARLLAPSLVVLEDIDLIATDRGQSRRTMLLHDLLDEMDVVCLESPVIYLMTTNRPDVIENALSLRPGRINQAIHFPLPDDDCRLRLLRHYLHGINASELDLAAMVERSRGTSAAFIEEWVRRATLFALDRQTAPMQETTVAAEDADAAIREIVESGGALTRKLLGHTVAT